MSSESVHEAEGPTAKPFSSVATSASESRSTKIRPCSFLFDVDVVVVVVVVVVGRFVRGVGCIYIKGSLCGSVSPPSPSSSHLRRLVPPVLHEPDPEIPTHRLKALARQRQAQKPRRAAVEGGLLGRAAVAGGGGGGGKGAAAAAVVVMVGRRAVEGVGRGEEEGDEGKEREEEGPCCCCNCCYRAGPSHSESDASVEGDGVANDDAAAGTVWRGRPPVWNGGMGRGGGADSETVSIESNRIAAGWVGTRHTGRREESLCLAGTRFHRGRTHT